MVDPPRDRSGEAPTGCRTRSRRVPALALLDDHDVVARPGELARCERPSRAGPDDDHVAGERPELIGRDDRQRRIRSRERVSGRRGGDLGPEFAQAGGHEHRGLESVEGRRRESGGGKRAQQRSAAFRLQPAEAASMARSGRGLERDQPCGDPGASRGCHRVDQNPRGGGNALGLRAVSLPGLPENAFGYILDFVNALTTVVHKFGGEVIVAGNMANSKQQLQQLAVSADYVVANTERILRGPEAPASQPSFEAALRKYAESVPAKKLIVGLAAYGCEVDGGDSCLPIAVQSAWHLMQRAGASLRFDLPALNGQFRYADGQGHVRTVWLLDAVTLFNQSKVALALAPAGLALWRLGYEDPGVWSVFAKGKLPNAKALAALKTIRAGLSFDDGVRDSEIVTMAGSNSEGSRTISYDHQLGLVVGQSIQRMATAKTFSGWSAKEKNALAITFDDGPDAENTEKVLDVLAQQRVPATFFVIGRNALQYPKVLKRIYDEGHDIGNHTFSHPRLSEVPEWRMRYELNGTQRVLEFLLGIRTRLFRPPYGGSAIAGQPENTAVLEEASRLGYTTVLSGVDAADWLTPSANVIHDRIVGRVVKGEGQIILLHVFGKKQATVTALSRIIATLKAKGYRFVTLHELLGEKRSEVMQHPRASALVGEAEGSYFSLVAYQGFTLLITALAIGVVALNLLRLVFSVGGTLRHKAIERSRAGQSFWPPSVAVIVPAFNEEKVIVKTITSILSDARNDLEIIVVDDGSTDNTAAVAGAAFSHDPRVRVFKKPNGGKAEASNFALRHTTADVVVALDADGVLDPRAIELLVRHFEDPRVGAVAGTAIVGNQINFLTRCQAIEYLVGQYLDRRALTLFNANAVVPGAIGAWRREALLGVGGYATDTLAEDCDATFAVIRAGWKVLYEPAAEARTEAPEKLAGFLKQRRRWMFGMLQVVGKHFSAVRGHPRSLGWLTIPHILVFGFFVSLATPILTAAFLYQSAVTLLDWSGGTDVEFTYHVSTYLLGWLLLSVIDLVVITIVLRIAGVPSVLRKIPLIMLQRVVYLPIIYWVAFETVLAAAKGKFVGWNKLKRTGSVTLAGADDPKIA